MYQQAVPYRQPLPDSSRFLFRLLGGFFALTIGANVVFSARAGTETPPAPDLALPATRANQTKIGASGPWGRLEYERIPLENFAERFPEGLKPLGESRWVFENYTAPQLTQFLRSLPLADDQKAALLDTNHWQTLTNGFAVTPTDDVVRNLSPAARQALYPVLGQSRQNPAQSQSFRFCPGSFDERMADSALPAGKIETLRRLVYTNSGCACLAIDKAVEQSLTTNEFQSLLETLYSIPTWRVNLRVTTKDDLDALLNYWARDGRQKALRPLLSSLAKRPGGDTISVAYFLPPYPRSRLYTYPDAATDAAALDEDCFYTSFNFFNDPPDPQFLNNHWPTKSLVKYYDQIHENPAFGDLIMLLNPSNSPVHMCVYIADDLVFTKNGQSGLQPWVFMKFSDLLAVYSTDPPLRMAKFRRKTTANTGITTSDAKPASVPALNQP
jgi:hypothetical protein